LQPATQGSRIPQLMSLIPHWLKSARLPCAKVLYGGRSYLILVSPDMAQSGTVTDVTNTPQLADGGL
jgi:hypothetical protein